jgi:hypothetical protein
VQQRMTEEALERKGEEADRELAVAALEVN